jgi:esterase/lipase
MRRWYDIFAVFTGLILGVYSSSCATVKPMNDRFAANSLWIDEPKYKPQAEAVVLMLHGLNLKPAKMDGWAELLSAHGAQVRRFALYGHAGDPSHMAQVTAPIWREQFDKAFHDAHSYAQELQIPLYFVGFSLGALVALEWLSGQPELNKMAKMVLIAPAIATPWYSHVAAGVLSVFSKNISLPSRSPKQYRANKGTTVAAYEALFELKNSLELNKFKNTNIPALVLIDKHDELVPSARIKKIITEHRLSQWQLTLIDNNFAQENYGFRHLMVDQESVGPQLWAELCDQVLNYLNLGSRGESHEAIKQRSSHN